MCSMTAVFPTLSYRCFIELNVTHCTVTARDLTSYTYVELHDKMFKTKDNNSFTPRTTSNLMLTLHLMFPSQSLSNRSVRHIR